MRPNTCLPTPTYPFQKSPLSFTSQVSPTLYVASANVQDRLPSPIGKQRNRKKLHFPLVFYCIKALLDSYLCPLNNKPIKKNKTMRDAEKTVGNMIDKEKTIFVGSVDAEGFPNIKAMLQTRKREGIKHIYLSTNTSSMRVSQFLKNNRACLYVCNTRFFKGVMLRGTMEILTDSTSKKMIWQEGDTMYYPEGVTDPDYCVLKFTAFSGRYYSGFKSEDFTIE